MIVAGQRQPILIATRPVDFRCGHRALALIVQTELKLTATARDAPADLQNEQCQPCRLADIGIGNQWPSAEIDALMPWNYNA